jgi:hypothetical protein
MRFLGRFWQIFAAGIPLPRASTAEFTSACVNPHSTARKSLALKNDCRV